MFRLGLNLHKRVLQALIPALRALPPRAASRVVAGIGQAEYALVPGMRLRFDRAVERGREYAGSHWDIPAVGRELAGNTVRWRARDQLLDGLTDAEVASLFTVRGREHLEAAFGEGRGLILLGNHFGAHMMPAHWMVRAGHDLRLFMERPNHISRFLSQRFETDGPLGQRKLFISRKADKSESAAAILRAARILKAKMAIFIANDVRWTGPHTAPARFLGNEYTFSATWVALAALTAAPVVSVFCRMNADGSYDLEFLPAFHVPQDAPSNGDARRWVQHSISALEERVLDSPSNSNDYFFWQEQGIALVSSAR